MSHPSADIAESPGRTEFVRAAETVRNRLGWLGFLRWLAAGHWAIALIGLGIVLWLRLGSGWRAGELRIVLGLLGAWIVVGIVVALARRPDRLRALLVWDEHGGWKERFSSAFAFADRSDRAAYEGERLHIATALRDLPDALARVKADLPAPSLRWVWVLPLLAVIFAASPLLRLPLDPSDALLDPEMVAEARNQAENLARDAEEVKKVDGLDDAEKKEFEKLSAAVDGAAEDLADAEGQTAREVLEALEARARAAEALADKLGLATDAWASEEMLREMSQHADTADLASALKDKNADRAADESDLLADTLDDTEIKLETQDRLSAALDRTTEKATDEDKTKPVGERFGNAARKLDDKQNQTAAREFEELAKHFRQVKQREEAQEKLRDLAEKLRESGSSISGSKLEKMQQLAGKGNTGKQPPGGLQPLQQNPLQNMPGITPMSQQPGQNAGQQAGNSGQSQQMPIREGRKIPRARVNSRGNRAVSPCPCPEPARKGNSRVSPWDSRDREAVRNRAPACSPPSRARIRAGVLRPPDSEPRGPRAGRAPPEATRPGREPPPSGSRNPRSPRPHGTPKWSPKSTRTANRPCAPWKANSARKKPSAPSRKSSSILSKCRRRRWTNRRCPCPVAPRFSVISTPCASVSKRTSDRPADRFRPSQ